MDFINTLMGYIHSNSDHWSYSAVYSFAIFCSLYLLYIFTKKPLLSIVSKIIDKTHWHWDSYLIKHNVVSRSLKLIMFIIYSKAINFLPAPTVIEASHIIANFFIVLFGLGVSFSLFDSVYDVSKDHKLNHLLPMKAILQILKIAFSLVGIVLIISSFLDRSPLVLLSGLGAFSAVLMLVFKDFILNFVALMQIKLQKMMAIGDWISMDQYGADGDVIDINLNGIVVMNWDKTTTSIPPSAFLNNSFKNYASMSASARRIKRNIAFDARSITFLAEDDLTVMKDIPVLRDYMALKLAEIEKNNAGLNESEIPFKGKKLTNIGTFRKYIEYYLRNHKDIHQDFTLLVRQLEATDKGVPIQVYAFVSNTAWVHFETVQSDIFDHLFAVANLFKLKVFQSPTDNVTVINN